MEGMDKINNSLKIQLSQEVMEINKGNINTKAVKSLLLLIREEFKYGSWIREFGDFVAHSERNRGKLKDDLTRPILKFLNEKSESVRVKYPKICDVWLNELNRFLKSYKLKIKDELRDAFSIVLFCSLQGCSIIIKCGNRVHLGVHTEADGSISLIAFFPGDNGEAIAIRVFSCDNIINAPTTDAIRPWAGKDIAYLVIEFNSGIPEFWQETAHVDMSDDNFEPIIRPHIAYRQCVTNFEQ